MSIKNSYGYDKYIVDKFVVWWYFEVHPITGCGIGAIEKAIYCKTDKKHFIFTCKLSAGVGSL